MILIKMTKNDINSRLFFFSKIIFTLFLSQFIFSQEKISDNFTQKQISLELNKKTPSDLLKQGDENYKKLRYYEALEYYKKALIEFGLIKKYNKKAEVYSQMGIVYSDINDYHSSLQYYVKAYEICETFKEKEQQANILSDIGELHLKFENYSKAFENLFLANKFYLLKPNKYKERLKNNYFLIGITYGSINKIDNSLFYFEKVLNQTRKKGNELFYGGLLNNIGAIYSKKNELTKALKYYNEALHFFYLLNDQKAIGVSLSNIAFIRKKEKKYNEAIRIYNKSIQYFIEINELYYLADVYINLSETYEASENFEMALSYSKKYLKIRNKLNNADIMSKISNLEIRQKIRKKNQEIKIINQKKLLIEKDNKLKKMWFYIMVIGIILLILISALIFRSLKISLKNNKLKQIILNQEKLQLTNNLEFKNKELEKFAFHIIEKNELLAQLKNELKEINPNKPENTIRIREISTSITTNLQIDKDRKEFEFQLDTIYQSFFLKLDNRFPNLTKNERRLCSLLVMELSSKDISVILNISPDSVKKNRYRLRKKMKINEDLNISEFLKDL